MGWRRSAPVTEDSLPLVDRTSYGGMLRRHRTRLMWTGALGTALAMLITGVLVGVFGLWGWFLAPKQHLPWIRGDERAAFAQAAAQHKGVMVDFGANKPERPIDVLLTQKLRPGDILELIAASDGGAFLLFTSYRTLNLAHAHFR